MTTIRQYSAQSIICDKSSAQVKAEYELVAGSAYIQLTVEDDAFGFCGLFTLYHPDNTYLRRLASAINGAWEPEDFGKAERDGEVP